MARLSDLVRETDMPSPGPDRLQGPGKGPGSIPPHRPGSPSASAGPGRRNEPDWYDLATVELERFAPVFQQGTIGNPGELPRIASGIVDSLQASDQLMVQVFAGSDASLLVANSVNVAVLAVKLGMGLQCSTDELSRVALAGLLHDVGMFSVPESIIEQSEPLTTSDREVIEQHPDTGAEVLATLDPSYAWVGQVAAQEHERWDGHGYPNGLKEGAIHPYAQLIGLADVFDALISPRPYHRRLLPHEAVREILVREKKGFSRLMMKTLVEQLSLYPLGTQVRLNTGEVGVVTGLKSRYPLRPTIHVGLQTELEAGESKVVDLSVSTLLHIVEVVKPVEVG